jgi:putative regulator of septum formation
LVLGILGLCGCGILAPFAWWMGQKELDAIQAGTRSPVHRGRAKAAKILGILGVVAIPLILVVSVILAGKYLAQRDSEGVIVRTGSVFLDDLRAGDCGDWPQGNTALSVTVHPCDEPHDFEVFAVVSHPDGTDEPYPEEGSLDAWSAQACYEQFVPYVGVAFEDSPTLTLSYFYPLATSWEDGNRLVQCALHTVEGEKLFGSKKGSAPATPEEASAFGGSA